MEKLDLKANLLTLKCSALENDFWHTRQTNFLPPGSAGAVITPIDDIMSRRRNIRLYCGEGDCGVWDCLCDHGIYILPFLGFENI